MPKCVICKSNFTPQRSSLEKTCQDNNCKYQYAMRVVEQTRKQTALKERNKRNEEKAALRDATKKRSDYERELQREINKLARLIDYGLPCIARPPAAGNEGGHYHSVGSSPAIRFNLHNIHRQSTHSNHHKAADTVAYSNGLVREYGWDYFAFVHFELMQIRPLKLAKEDFKRLIKEARILVKEFEAANLQLQTPRTPEQRREMRDYINNRLRIY